MNSTNGEWRTVQSSTRQRLRGPFGSIDDIVELLSVTLVALDFDRRKVPWLKSNAIKYDSQDATSVKKAYCSASWLMDVQQAILGPIATDWSEQLQKEQLWRPIINVFFVPRQADLKNDDDGTVTAKIVAAGLQTCAWACTKYTKTPTSDEVSPGHSTNTAPLSILTTLETVVQSYCKKDFNLIEQLVISSESEQNQARRKLSWQDALQTLISLPDRLANVFQGKIPESISSRKYFTCLYQQIFRLVAKGNPSRTDALADVLSRFIRHGHLATLSSREDSSDMQPFWSVAIQFASRQSNQQSTWSAVTHKLAETDRLAICSTLLNFLNHCAIQSERHNLIATQEYGKPAICGKRFLSRDAAEMVSAQLSVLRFFLPDSDGKKRNSKTSANSPDSDSDSDADSDEDEERHLSQTLYHEVILNSDRTFSPIIARALALHISGPTRVQDIKDYLMSVVDKWGDAARIRRTTIREEHFFTTLVLGLLTETKRHTQTTPPHPSSSSAMQIGQLLTARQSFIEGVASHLDHLDPQIRRLAMLLAELVSEAQHDELTSKPQGSEAASSVPKKLTFGNRMWDGSGEGKDECHVLRAMYYSWGVLQKDVKVEDASLPQALGIQAHAPVPQKEADEIKIESLQIGPSKPRKERAAAPVTRSLPAKVAPPKRGPLIMEMDDDDDDQHNIQVTNAQSTSIESEGEESSSDSDSSDDEDGGQDAAQTFAGLGGEGSLPNFPSAPGKSKSGRDDDEEAYELNTRKRRRPPIYIWEIGSMLREQDRDANRIALKEAATLIRRKAGWGGEVDEHSIDLAFVLTSMQNNYSIKSFEARRSSALTALVIASPRLTVGALIEHFFSDNTSIAQRFAILNALAEGSRELAGLSSLGTQGDIDLLVKSNDGRDGRLTYLTDSITQGAITRARQEGEERVPEIKAEQKLKVTSQRMSTTHRPGGGGLIKEITSSNKGIAKLPGAIIRPQERYVDLASSVFIFPLLNRLRAHVSDTSSRFSRLTSWTNGLAIGTGSLYDPKILTALLDTLSILINSSKTSLDFVSFITFEILEAAMMINSVAIPLSLSGANSSLDGATANDISSSILGSLASLILIVLDTCYEIDAGKYLLANHSSLVNDVNTWASMVFQQHEQTEKGGVDKSKLLSRSRAERCTAAIVLRVEEMRSHWRRAAFGSKEDGDGKRGNLIAMI
ncbi:unnamed protein product [Sympodiomycopsis kandeliae]